MQKMKNVDDYYACEEQVKTRVRTLEAQYHDAWKAHTTKLRALVEFQDNQDRQAIGYSTCALKHEAASEDYYACIKKSAIDTVRRTGRIMGCEECLSHETLAQ